jgi:aminoglycoside phosphotransferase (APT) family kinase protein
VDVPGAARVEAWLQRQPGFAEAAVTRVEPLTDGYSNVTCRLLLEGAPVPGAVLRLQPERGIFEPYDALREAGVLRCLATTDVPVPAVLAEEPDPTQLGAAGFLMEWIDAPHMGADGADIDFGRFFEALVGVHAVDWEQAELGFLGVPGSPADGFVAEVRLVADRMDRAGVVDPLLVAAADQLLHAEVPGGRLALCQGDANVFNYLVRDGQVVGVVDWEQARISDPRSDVGQLEALGLLKGVPYGPPDQMLWAGMYHDAGGDPPEHMGPFRAMWLFQLGFINRAYTALHGGEPWYTWAQIEDLLPQALDDL